MARIGIIGSEGRMGHALVKAIEAAGHEVAGGVDKGGDAAGLADRSEALVDFSAPGALESNLHAAIGAGIPILVGTTGLEEKHDGAINAAARAIPVLQTGNTSLGVTVLAHLVREVAARVGLENRLRHRPAQLSGGQQQRVAIARALVTRPEVIFADEPTGALDTKTGREVLALLRAVVDADGHTVVMVTHDPVAAAQADQVILLADGRLVGTLDAPDADEVAEHLAHLGG